MVATDIAARGIDVEGISHVINFDVPSYAEDYLHRIGRTGRATATGDAMTFVSQQEVLNLRKIEKFIERKFKAKTVDGFAYSHQVDIKLKPAGKKAGKRSKRSKPGSAQRRRSKAKTNSGPNSSPKAKPKQQKSTKPKRRRRR
jgi:ATP-dependent RNA helicase RhlE